MEKAGGSQLHFKITAFLWSNTGCPKTVACRRGVTVDPSCIGYEFVPWTHPTDVDLQPGSHPLSIQHHVYLFLVPSPVPAPSRGRPVQPPLGLGFKDCCHVCAGWDSVMQCCGVGKGRVLLPGVTPGLHLAIRMYYLDQGHPGV